MPRKRSPHPGVVIRPARPGQYQRTQIRYTDPDSGKQKYETVPEGVDVREFAIRKSVSVSSRCLLLKDGAPRMMGAKYSEFIEAYFREAILRPATVEMYKISTGYFRKWAEGKITSGDDLTLARLRELRAWLAKLPDRAPSTVNRDLRTLAAVLEHSRKAGRCPRLTREAISDGLERIKAPIDRKDFCRDVRGVLERCIDHDLDFGAYVAFLVLTGMRSAEALCVTADSIDFELGLVRLQASETKTARWRDVELQFAPACYVLCEALVLGRKGKLFGDKTASYMREQRRQLGGGFTFQELRRTASTYLCSMPNVGLWRAAKSLGHNPEIARKHYAGVVRTNAQTLEEALGVKDVVIHLALELKKRRGASLPARALVRVARP